jgi:hypothetical protein
VKILEAKCERVITELSWGLLLVSIFSGVDADEEVLFNVVYQAWLLSLSQFWNSKPLQSLLSKSLSFCIEALLLIPHGYAVWMLNNWTLSRPNLIEFRGRVSMYSWDFTWMHPIYLKQLLGA